MKTKKAPANFFSNNHFSLSTLIGNVDADIFFSDIWEKKYHIFSQISDFKWLFDPDTLGDILLRPCQDISGKATMGKMTESSYDGIVVSHEDNSVDMLQTYRLWSEGYSLIVPALHMRCSSVASFTEQLTSFFGFKVEVNLYYTPTNAVAFPPHYDNHDIFIVQLIGEKKWHLYPSDNVLPLPDQRYNINDPIAKQNAQHPFSTKLLVAGDVMYLPRGQVHSAKATSIPSMHLSIGIYPVLWQDLINELIVSKTHKLETLRRSIPPRIYHSKLPEKTSQILASLTQDLQLTPSEYEALYTP